MRICTGEIFDSNVVYLITPLCSVRPDQYYTDVIARPMSGIGRKPVAGRDVEVVPRNSEMHIQPRSRLWQRRSSSSSQDSSSSCRRVCRHSRVELCLQVINISHMQKDVSLVLLNISFSSLLMHRIFH